MAEGGLQKFLCNLPKGMLNDVKSYRSHCVPAVIENLNGKTNEKESVND
eukprot:CAMPEP_0183708214 /NCGR_PEP_ID=MMETSP0737-20130205/4594_1 /TAXON_ID=385413 /ORGANISM="Thalassiosira miniscula, Strain CCMP1093" /LENGTH=48 /DNA_ID= /DNA_START= /DNA_END= /DNA_ORIENTATION=